MSDEELAAAEKACAERQAQIDAAFDLVEKDLARIEVSLIKLEREADAVLARQAELRKKFPELNDQDENEHGEYDDYEVPPKEGAPAPIPFDE